MTTTTTHETEDELRDVLDRMNGAGYTPELAAADRNGTPFIAALGDEGDTAALVIITADSLGWPTGRRACSECGSEGPLDWAPTYPVTALGGEW